MSYPCSFGIGKFFEIIGTPPHFAAIKAACNEKRAELIDLSFWQPYQARVSALQIAGKNSLHYSYNETVTVSGQWGTTAENELFSQVLYELRPWRKGPFQLMGIDIDSEWRSHIKWDRIAPHLPDLRNAVVGDFGCNNGYYMFRMLEHSPKAVLGLDPNGRFYYQFDLLHQLFRPHNLFFEPLGVEHASLFDNVFDVVFCLGVIYHRKDPLSMLSDLKRSLKPGGTVVLESITIPKNTCENEDGCLAPKDRYAMMRNVYRIPTPDTFMEWVIQAGFAEARIIDTSVTTTFEQRKTEFAHFDSLVDFLDPDDQTKTVEGYPVPQRTIITARAPS